MEYGGANGAAGKVPEFGAIFMSNIFTKKECFRRKLFGLPSAMANFAKQVKPGMILFLFEFERRELFGVFCATSAGAINIVPEAFCSSGSFPAQVRVDPIWSCRPLPEHEFQDAIKENYFSAKKFNFGLSEDQVHRLLCLFSTKKLKKGVPGRQFAVGEIGDDTTSNIVEFEPSDKKVGYGRFSVGNMAEFDDDFDYDNKDVLIDNAGDSWGKRRRIDDDYEALSGKIGENKHFDYHPSQQILRNEHNRFSLVEERRVASDWMFLTNDRLTIEHEMNKSSPLHRVKVEKGCNIRKSGTSESRYSVNDRLENELNMDRRISPVVSMELGDYVDRLYVPIMSPNHDASVYLGKPVEKEYSSPVGCLKELAVFDRPYHTFPDEVVGRTIPYDPEEPDLNCLELKYRSPTEVNSTSHQSVFESLRRRLDIPLGYKNKVLSPEVLPEFQKFRGGSTPIHVNASNHRGYPSYVTGNALSVSSDYIPLLQVETLEMEKKCVSCSLLEPHQDVEYKISSSENDDVVPRMEILSDVGGCSPESAAKAPDGSVRPQSSGSMHCDSNNKRSVFARLTLAPHSQEQDNGTQADASVDDVMNFSRQSQTPYVMTRKCKPFRSPDDDKNIRMNDFFALHDPITYEQTMIKAAMEEADAELNFIVNQIIEKSGEPVPEETRIVEFKRRSAIKKNHNEPTTKDTLGNAESKVPSVDTEELVDKTRKRRKLVRPDFTKKDSIDESFSSDGALNLVLCSSNTASNVELVQETCLTKCEGDNAANTEQEVNSGNCGIGTEASNEILDRLNHLLSKVKSKNVTVGTSNEDTVVNLAA